MPVSKLSVAKLDGFKGRFKSWRELWPEICCDEGEWMKCTFGICPADDALVRFGPSIITGFDTALVWTVHCAKPLQNQGTILNRERLLESTVWICDDVRSF